MPEESSAREVIELVNAPGEVRAVHLSRPELSAYTLGENAGFLLRTALFGRDRVELYEVVSGTDRYPPGRIAKVTLSFEELDRLMGEYQKHQAAQENRERACQEKRAAHIAWATDGASDFDPFFDSDPSF